MKRVIRSNCFETNSSSMHSIVITRNDSVLTADEVDKEVGWNSGVLRIYSEDDLEFERSPFQVLAELRKKCAYAIASFCEGESKEYCEAFVKDLETIIRKAYPNLKHIELPTIEENIFYDVDGNKLDPQSVYTNYLYQDSETGCGPEYYT